MAARMALVFAALLSLTTGRQAHAQATAPSSSAHPGVLNALAHEAIVLRLGESARLQGMRLAVGPNRFTSALVLSGIGAGVGALVGLAIEKS